MAVTKSPEHRGLQPGVSRRLSLCIRPSCFQSSFELKAALSISVRPADGNVTACSYQREAPLARRTTRTDHFEVCKLCWLRITATSSTKDGLPDFVRLITGVRCCPEAANCSRAACEAAPADLPLWQLTNFQSLQSHRDFRVLRHHSVGWPLAEQRWRHSGQLVLRLDCESAPIRTF